MNENFNSAPAQRKKPSVVTLGMTMFVSVVLAALGISTADKAGTLGFAVLVYVISFALTAISTGIFATFIVVRVRAIYFMFCPVAFAVGAVIISLFGGGIEKQLVLLSFIVAGAIGALCINGKSTRTGTVIGIAAGAALCLVAAFIYAYVSAGNEFSVDAIKTFFTDKVKSAQEQAENFVKEVFLPYLRTINSYSTSKTAISETDFIEFASDLIYTAAVLLPGIILMLLQIFGFVATCVFKYFVERLGCDVVLPSPRWELYPTSVTAWVYIVAYGIYAVSSLISSFSNGGSGIVTVIALNVILTVFPVMIWLGGSALFGKRRRVRFRIGGGFIILIILGVFIMPTMIVAVISFIGAWSVIGRRRADAAEEKKENDDNDSNDF
ncbi:MAG: hypothetical protein IJR55_03060 [Clostridia bacterium]|nr:hypothetical protein [Clostridia bacterium]